MSITVESLPNVVADTVNKMSQIKGSGLYIAATSKKLTDEEISTFVGYQSYGYYLLCG